MSARTLKTAHPPAFGRAERQAFLESFWAMDAALVRAGFHALSDWWKAEITRFVLSGCRRWTIRAGRRAGKSSALARLAVAVAWFGAWSVPAGDTAIVPFISVSKDEAGARLRTIGAILTALGLEHDPRGEEIELTGPHVVVFRAIACTTKASVGFTSIFVACDEVARWESRETGANPAAEVIGSLAPTMGTQRNAWLVLSSSPWSQDDYHAERFDEGDSEHQCVSFAPTWIANPSLSEADTRALEPDERTWLREYGAEPGATVTAALDHDDVIACFGRTTPAQRANPFVAIDASSLRGDGFGWLEGGVAGGTHVVISRTSCIEAEELRRVSMGDVVTRIAHAAKALGAETIYGDQREEAGLRTLFGQSDLRLRSYAWSTTSKDAAVQLLRRWMRERLLQLPDDDKLRAELLAMRARLVPSGQLRYDHAGDRASCLVTLAHAFVAGDLQLKKRELDLSMPRTSGRGWARH